MIETESRGPARWIFIANPKVVNAVGTADLERLREEIVSAAADDAIALIVLAGRGAGPEAGCFGGCRRRVVAGLTLQSLSVSDMRRPRFSGVEWLKP